MDNEFVQLLDEARCWKLSAINGIDHGVFDVAA
jgi:hypothetical protein